MIRQISANKFQIAQDRILVTIGGTPLLPLNIVLQNNIYPKYSLGLQFPVTASAIGTCALNGNELDIAASNMSYYFYAVDDNTGTFIMGVNLANNIPCPPVSGPNTPPYFVFKVTQTTFVPVQQADGSIAFYDYNTYPASGSQIYFTLYPPVSYNSVSSATHSVVINGYKSIEVFANNVMTPPSFPLKLEFKVVFNQTAI
jgi:hypothetical protein